MNTLKDEIRDVVMEYHNDTDHAPDPEVLVEALTEIVREKLMIYLQD
jgi:hypothetical protein